MVTHVTTVSLDRRGESWLMRCSEQSVRCLAMFLVLTGQMLPSGAATAQDDPPSPSFASPFSVSALIEEEEEEEAAPTKLVEEDAISPELADDPPPAEPATEKENLPDSVEPMSTEATDAALPTVETPGDASVDAKSDEPADPVPQAEPTADPAAEPSLPQGVDEAAPAADMNVNNEPLLPIVEPAETAPVTTAENTYSFGDWTVTVRPGPSAPRPTPVIQAPLGEYPLPQNNVHVPVNVSVNQIAPQSAWSGWGAPWAYPAYWTAPTSAYLFQRPQPYWQLRQDFYHLRPFISGLW